MIGQLGKRASWRNAGPNFPEPVSLRTALRTAELSHDTDDRWSSHEMRRDRAGKKKVSLELGPGG